MNIFLKNNETGEIGIFSNYQTGWTPASAEDPPLPQAEIDAFLLMEAKKVKSLELDIALNEFQQNGYIYNGAIVCAVWDSQMNYKRKDLVLASDGKNYKSLKCDNLNNEPPSSEWWEEYYPCFKTNDKTTTNIILKNDLPAATPDRYIFGAECNIPVNFGEAAKWDDFFAAILSEKDRIMRKYDNYQDEIDLCATLAELEAIVIDFSI